MLIAFLFNKLDIFGKNVIDILLFVLLGIQWQHGFEITPAENGGFFFTLNFMCVFEKNKHLKIEHLNRVNGWASLVIENKTRTSTDEENNH